jgi:hypothetical protein
MPQIDIGKVVSDIKTAATGVLGKDISAVEGFAETQLQMLAQQAAWIAQDTLSGQLSADLRDYFLENLKTLTGDFLNTLRGLVVITLEKLWNAVVGVLWDAIGSAIGVNLVAPQKPV